MIPYHHTCAGRRLSLSKCRMDWNTNTIYGEEKSLQDMRHTPLKSEERSSTQSRKRNTPVCVWVALPFSTSGEERQLSSYCTPSHCPSNGVLVAWILCTLLTHGITLALNGCPLLLSMAIDFASDDNLGVM